MRHSNLFQYSMACLIGVWLLGTVNPLFAQEPAINKAELIGAGVVSSKLGEYSPSFDVNTSELVFMRRTPGKFDYTLYSSKYKDGIWTEPKVLPFSGEFRDGGPSFSPNGNYLAFDSKRPSNGLAKESINLWLVDRADDGQWGEPIVLFKASSNLPSESKAGADEFGPVVSNNGDVLFYSFRSPRRGGAFYTASLNQAPAINTALPDPSLRTFVGYITVSSDGTTAVIEGKGVNSSSTDLYYSCKTNAGWSIAKPLSAVNTVNGEGTPYLTADNQWLWFASDRDTGLEQSKINNLYRISTQNLPIPCR